MFERDKEQVAAAFRKAAANILKEKDAVVERFRAQCVNCWCWIEVVLEGEWKPRGLDLRPEKAIEEKILISLNPNGEMDVVDEIPKWTSKFKKQETIGAVLGRKREKGGIQAQMRKLLPKTSQVRKFLLLDNTKRHHSPRT